jgi:hypothetical protein
MAATDPEAPAAGTELESGYVILDAISTGAMGAVYRARRRETGETVALKRLLSREHAVGFEAEARLLQRLSHPRVVRFLDHFEEESGNYLVMELIEGVDLSLLLSEQQARRLQPRDAVDFVLQACEALDYVHSQQIVHRDVKPKNLILSGQGIVLVDFGVAREIPTGTWGTVVGTPQFMAPEVLAGGAATPRSDVFGIAATLATLIVGSPPAYGRSPALREVAPDLDPAVEAAIRGGLELAVERRIPSVAAFARALDSPLPGPVGRDLALSVPHTSAPPRLLQAIVRTAAGVFDAAASSLALVAPGGSHLVYQAAWGAGADEIVGVRLEPGVGIAGRVARERRPVAVADCRADPRFAAHVAERTGYVPRTMLTVPLLADGEAVGVLSILDRRDGRSYMPEDIPRAELLAELALVAIETEVPTPVPPAGGGDRPTIA